MATEKKEWSNSSDDSTSAPSDINLAFHANRIYRRAKEVYQKLEMLNYLSAGADDETDSCTMQSTPCYTDSSIEHLIKLPTNVPGREDKILVVVILSITFFVQMFSRDFYMPFFESSLMAHPQRLQLSLPLLPVLNTVVSVLLTIPACVTINKYGIRTCLLYSCAISSLGASIRCLSIGDSTLILHMSAVLLSSTSVVVKPLTATVSTCCFLVGERNLATGFLTIASMTGAAGGLLMKKFMRPEELYPLSATTNNQMHTYNVVALYICSGANFVCLQLAFFLFPRESNKRKLCDQSTDTVKKCMVPSTSFLLQTVFKSIRQNSDLVYIAMSYACSNALSWPWYQMIDITYSKVGFPQEVAMNCRLWMIIHTFVLSLSVCWLADRRAGSNKHFGLVCQCLSTLFMLWVVLTLCCKILRRRTTSMVTGVMFAFPLSWTTQSLLYELAADFAQPLPENLAVGLVCMLEIWCENSIYILLSVFPRFHFEWLHVVTFIAGFLSALFITLLNGKKVHRYYN
ncbi:hypothetical protein QTP88_001639 [Uroleucon formosanum]